MNQPLDDLQDGQKDGLAFYSTPLANRVDLFDEIKVPQAVFEKGERVVDDHLLFKLYRDFKALRLAHVKSVDNIRRKIDFDRIHTILSELIEKQQVSPPIDDNTFKHPALPFLEPYRALIQVILKHYRSPKEMILIQYEVFPSNLRHPHSIVRQVAWLLLGHMIEYHSPELRTAQAAADNASYRRQIIPKLPALFEPLYQALKDPDAGVSYHACCTLQKVVDQLMRVMDSATVQTEFHKFDYISVLKDRLLDPESDLMILDLLNTTLHNILLHKQIILASCSSMPKAELLYQQVRLKCFPSLAADPKFTKVYDYFKQADKLSNDDQLLWEILQTRYALYHLHNSSKKIEELLSKGDYKGIHQLLDDSYLTDPAAFTPVLIRKFQQMISTMQTSARLSLFMEREEWKQFKFLQVKQKLLDKMQQVEQCWEQKRSEGLKTQGSIHRGSSSPSLKMPDLSPSIAQQASSSAQSPKPIFDSEELARLDEHEFTQCKLETLHLVESTQLLGSQQPGPSSGLATQSPWRATEEKRKVDPAKSKDGEGSYDSQQSGQAPCCSYLPTFSHTNKTSKKDLSPREAMPLSPRRQNANKGESKWKVSHVETTPPSPSGQGDKKSCCIS